MNCDDHPEPEQWVERYGDLLFRYAFVRVRREDVAADLVQEALVEAWAGRHKFTGRAAAGTWLVGILRHKIADYYRRLAAEQRAGRVPLEAEPDPGERHFTRRGLWRDGPAAWPAEPGADLERAEFWVVFRACLEHLPKSLAEVFILREVDGLESDEICQLLGITPTNLWTRLHRARLQLRACLERRWFEPE